MTGLVEDLVAKLVALSIPVGVQQRGNLDAAEFLHAQGVVDGRFRGEIHRPGSHRPLGDDIVSQVLGTKHVHLEDQDFRATGGRLGVERQLDMPVIKIVQEATQIGIAPRLIDDADDRGLLREPHHDVTDIERQLILSCPEIENVRAGWLVLAADDPANEPVPGVDQLPERVRDGNGSVDNRGLLQGIEGRPN